MLALEFVKPGVGDGRVPDPDLTKRVLAEALSRRLIVLSAGTYANVTRIIPPLGDDRRRGGPGARHHRREPGRRRRLNGLPVVVSTG